MKFADLTFSAGCHLLMYYLINIL